MVDDVIHFNEALTPHLDGEGRNVIFISSNNVISEVIVTCISKIGLGNYVRAKKGNCAKWGETIH